MKMDFNKKLEVLKQIKEVDAPPFLLTRIKQQIQNLQHTQAPAKWKWAFAFTSVLLLLFNISILIKSSALSNKKNSGVENIINSLSLSAANDLYND